MVLPLVSCQTLGHELLTDAHASYERGDYAAAAELYEAVIAADDNLATAYFFLANSYDNLYRPARRGDAGNDRWLELAIDNYMAAVDRETDAMKRIRTMRYLAAAYGPDRLNDQTASESLLRQLIEAEPSDAGAYIALARIREDAGRTDEAEQLLLRARDLGDDVEVLLQLAGFYVRTQRFEPAMEALRRRATLEPDNPEAFYTIGTYYWEKAFRDARLSEVEEDEIIMLGLDAMNRALALKSDYVEALVYKNILLRMQANHSDDSDLQERLIDEADALRDRARELAARGR